MLRPDDYPTVRQLIVDYLWQVEVSVPTPSVAGHVARHWPPSQGGPLDDSNQEITYGVFEAMLMMLGEDPPLIELAHVSSTMIETCDTSTPLADTVTGPVPTWRLTKAGKTWALQNFDG